MDVRLCLIQVHSSNTGLSEPEKPTSKVASVRIRRECLAMDILLLRGLQRWAIRVSGLDLLERKLLDDAVDTHLLALFIWEN